VANGNCDQFPEYAPGVQAGQGLPEMPIKTVSKITELTTSLAALTPGTDEHRRTDEELTDAQYEEKNLPSASRTGAPCTWCCAKPTWTKPRAAAPASKPAGQPWWPAAPSCKPAAV
jgi:hypothetical protein